MSYSQAQRRQHVKGYLDQRYIEQQIKERDERRDRSLKWLERYRASGKAKTSFDWRPKLGKPIATNLQETINVEEGEVSTEA